MSYIVTFLIGAALGAIAGLLAYRNNLDRAKAIEAKAKSIADEFKK
jgi:hypothetical protein